MTKKNQMSQANDLSNSVVELSDEDLQQVVGGLVYTLGSDGVFTLTGNTDLNGNDPFLTSEALNESVTVEYTLAPNGNDPSLTLGVGSFFFNA